MPRTAYPRLAGQLEEQSPPLAPGAPVVGARPGGRLRGDLFRLVCELGGP